MKKRKNIHWSDFFLIKKSPPRRTFRGREDLEKYQKHRELARVFVLQKLEKFNQYYNFTYRKIVIRNQRTRWGSCSSQKNLNFNYKILFLPESLADYLIVHELCHLKEFNHSAKFWALVAEQIPDYLERRKALRKHSLP